MITGKISSSLPFHKKIHMNYSICFCCFILVLLEMISFEKIFKASRTEVCNIFSVNNLDTKFLFACHSHLWCIGLLKPWEIILSLVSDDWKAEFVTSPSQVQFHGCAAVIARIRSES